MSDEDRSRLIEAAAHLLAACSKLILVPGTLPTSISGLIEEATALLQKAQE